MTAELQDNATTDAMNCPTCGARQNWSDQCRRCKCDLGPLRAAWEACEAARLRCLVALRDEDLRTALRWARRYHQWHPNSDARRLLAACHLALGNWAQVTALAVSSQA